MFIKKLFRYDKVHFAIFFIYLFSFIYLNYKSGLIVSPIMQYGMYSNTSKISDTIYINRIYINDTLLDFSKLPMASRDVLDVTIDNFYQENKTNTNVFFTMKKILRINSFMSDKDFNNHISEIAFLNKYKQTAATILQRKINNVKIIKEKYIWDKNFSCPALTKY